MRMRRRNTVRKTSSDKADLVSPKQRPKLQKEQHSEIGDSIETTFVADPPPPLAGEIQERPLAEKQASFLYYLENFGHLMNDLRMNVISLALFVVAFTFIEFGVAHPDVLGMPQFWLRALLLMLAVIFTSYDILAFELYARSKIFQHRSNYDNVSSTKVSLLFIVELSMLAVNALIISMPLITLEEAVMKASSTSIYYLFLVIGAWHTINIIWYAIDFTGYKDFFRHFTYGTLNYSAFGVFYLIADGSLNVNFSQLGFEVAVISVHALIILGIYSIQVRHFVSTHIRDVLQRTVN